MSRGHPTAASHEATAAGSDSSPRLSVAVAAHGIDVSQLERFLAALGQLGDADEILIAVAPARTQTDEFERWLAAASLGPAVGIVLHPADTTPMRLWGFAMASARGRYVAVLDARDAPAAGWLSGWREAAASHPGAIVWGPVAPGRLDHHCSWAAYLAEYGQFWSVEQAANSGELPGNNLVFPRAALPSAETLRAEGFWKTFHLDALQDRARETTPATTPEISAAPEMLVRVERSYRLGDYLQRRYLHGRCYGGRRLLQPGAPPRMLCLAFSPLLPLLRTVRVLSRLGGAHARGDAHGATQASWPRAALGPLILGEVAWSWGEFAGYARGPGNACEELA
jgi:hypothetical protein